MKEVRGIRSGFSWRFSSGKASQRQKEWNNGPLNQIRILDRRSIQSRGSGLIFLPSSPCFLPALPISAAVFRLIFAVLSGRPRQMSQQSSSPAPLRRASPGILGVPSSWRSAGSPGPTSKGPDGGCLLSCYLSPS